MGEHCWALHISSILVAVAFIGAAMFSIESEAADETRRSNLKSQGVYTASDEEGNSVTLAAQDLVYLADQIDVLEQTVNALSQEQNASIEYTYHVHTGDSVHGGGCYSTGYHAHTSACPYTRKQGREPCPWGGTDYVVEHGVKTWNGSEYVEIDKTWEVCKTCGHRSSNLGSHSRSFNYTVYNCGSPINVWVLSCGKTEQTIESAYIVFN